MKLYLLSDNVDTLTGMRLAGVDGIVAHTADEVLSAMKHVLEDSSIGILLVTKKLYLEFSEKLLENSSGFPNRCIKMRKTSVTH